VAEPVAPGLAARGASLGATLGILLVVANVYSTCPFFKTVPLLLPPASRAWPLVPSLFAHSVPVYPYTLTASSSLAWPHVP